MFKSSVPPFRGYTAPGSVPTPPEGVVVEDGETLDFISGHWRIFQYKKGHRFSTDDVLVGWYGSQWAPTVSTYCDLGSGIGSVAMVVMWRRPGCRVLTVEAQERSFRLQQKTLAYNGLQSRVTQLLGDLRDVDAYLPHAPFDLVTGSPPYWDEADALPADHPQAVPARLEVRGSVADYAATAAQLLAPGGVFATVFPDVQHERVVAGLEAAGLRLIRSRAVRFKEGVDSRVSGLRLYLAGRAQDLPETFTPWTEPPLTIRNKDGSVTDEYSAIKMSFGFAPG